MSQPYVGQILLFAGTYAPYGYALCDGSLLRVDQFDTLFNLIGATYGGDGIQTFALPDLRSRTSLGMGTGPELASFGLGQSGGSEAVTLMTDQFPAHSHPAIISVAAASFNTPSSSALFADQTGESAVRVYAPYNSAGQTQLTANTVGTAGGSQPHENRQPFVAITICIAVYGTYPSKT